LKRVFRAAVKLGGSEAAPERTPVSPVIIHRHGGIEVELSQSSSVANWPHIATKASPNTDGSWKSHPISGIMMMM
jgi:hypothetical protein